jgi:DNA-binding response OmpR family regulator
MHMPLLRASKTRDEDTRPDVLCDVLIVEDDPTQAEEIACYLSRARLAVQILHSGSEALHCVAEMRPRVALLDYNLPDLDGVTVAERIRRLSPETAMLMMSGRIDGLPEPTLRKVGLYSFVNKPVQPSQLLNSVRRMVRTASRTGLPATAPQKWLGLSFG